MARTTDSDLVPQELRVLVAVADTGAFSAAAETLGLTQSAVSHSVRGSERKIGAVLFDRGRTGARPTLAGDKAVAHARRVLRLLDVLTTDRAPVPLREVFDVSTQQHRSPVGSVSCRTRP
ncbi:LysR family transcriptional regulator, partial [Streptomyces populi]